MAHPGVALSEYRTTSYSVDAVGNTTTITDPSSRVTTNTYDTADELTSISYSDGVTPNVTNITYDDDGQRTAMTDGTGTSTWGYDSLHRLTSSTSGNGQTVGYGFDLGGRMTSIVYPGSIGTVTRGYDDANPLSSITDWASHQTAFSYDPDSNLTTQTYPNTTTASNGFDNADRLMSVSAAPTRAPGSPFASFTYGRNGNDQLSSVTSTGVPSDNHSYGYTPLNQLSTVDSSTYGYDYADNLTGRTDGTVQAFDVANELTSSTPIVPLVGSASDGNNNANSITLSMPAGTTANDVAIVTVVLPHSKSVTTPTGYTAVGTWESGTASSDAKVVVFRKTITTDTNVVCRSARATPRVWRWRCIATSICRARSM